MTNPLIAARDLFAAAHPEERVVLNGRDWGVIDIGAGDRTLLLIPGTLGRADIFWQQIEALAPRLRVIAVSYPATGGVADWAGDLAALLDARGVARAAVLGSSLGGYLAQYLAALHPGRVSVLFAANTLSDASLSATRPPYTSDLDAGPIEELRAGFGTGLRAWAAAHPDQSDLVDLLLAEVGGRIPEAELRNRLKGIKHAPPMPAAVLPAEAVVTIESADDPLIPPVLRAGVRSHLRPATAVRFGWGGHFPYVVRPADYSALLADALGLSGRPLPEGEVTL